MLVVNRFASIQNLQIVFGRVVKFDHIAFGGIENSIEFVVLIEIAGSEPATTLRFSTV